jgi:hypothetical protein
MSPILFTSLNFGIVIYPLHTSVDYTGTATQIVTFIVQVYILGLINVAPTDLIFII